MPTKSIVAALRARLEQEKVAEVAEATGLSRGQLYHFLAGTRTLTLESADKVCHHLKLELVERKR